MRRTKTWQQGTLLVMLAVATVCAPGLAAGPNSNAQLGSIPYFNFNAGSQSWLGVAIRNVTRAMAQQLKLPGVYGAFVMSVFPGSPAAKAGLKENDVILEFAGERVRSIAQLHRLIVETPPGRKVSIKINRAGKLETLQAKIENRSPNFFSNTPGSPKFDLGPLPNARLHALPPPWFRLEPAPRRRILPLPPATPFNNPFMSTERVLGISGDNLTPQLARFFGVKEGHGVLVSEVIDGSPASVAGLRAGDVIVRVGSQAIGSVEELRWALQAQQNKQHEVTLAIVRNRRERDVSVLLNLPEPYQGQSAHYRNPSGMPDGKVLAGAKPMALFSVARHASLSGGWSKLWLHGPF